ncbi:MAG TPA: PadR family transcriptional regulator [Dehalococcoidales bacterium]|nr:PadR family transcriptional regulator [Dehalococcoidales bacterium]
MFGRHFAGYGPHGFGTRMFEKGALKYVVLDLLNEKPRHGYEIIKALEGSFHGFYTPSAGSIYPTLQMLEDLGYVKATDQDGKKIYNITDEGRAYLKEHKEHVDGIKSHMHDWHSQGGHPEMRETMFEFFDTMRLLRSRFHDLEPEKIEKIRSIISKACQEIRQTVA